MAKLTKEQWEARRKEALAQDLPPSAGIAIEVGGTKVALPAGLREFSTGSRGYHASERLTTAQGAFLVNVTITQIGSGPYKG